MIYAPGVLVLVGGVVGVAGAGEGVGTLAGDESGVKVW